MPNTFKEKNTSSTGHKHCTSSLISNTSNAVLVTLDGLAYLIPKLLDSGFHYALTGEFQSYPVLDEIGITWKQLGGNFYISGDEVLSTLHLQRLNNLRNNRKSQKLFRKVFLDETEIDCLNNCFKMSNKLT